MTRTGELRCSFCSITARELPGRPLIAGPSVYICADCVELCSQIVVENRAVSGLEVVSGAADTFATMTADLEASRSRVRTLEAAIKTISQAVARVMPAPHSIRCMWCDATLDGDDVAREHVATCDKHPAVIALRARDSGSS